MRPVYESYQRWDQDRRDDLIRSHLPLVYSLARRVSNTASEHGVEYGDLVNSGVIGLYRALDRFDEDKGVPFGSYATSYVRGAILEELRRLNKVPRSLREKYKRFRATFDTLCQQLLRSPTDEEIASSLEISNDELQRWLVDLGWTTVWSLDELDDEERDLIDQGSDRVTDALGARETKAILIQNLKRLSVREQQVLYAYYEEELTLREIAYAMDLSESQISRIHSKAILRLRGMLGRKKHDLTL